MTNFPCVHHIEVGAVDGEETVESLTSVFKFKVKATRRTEVANQWLLVKNNSRFLVTSLKTRDEIAIQNDSFVVNWTTPSLSPDSCTFPSKDSVFNVAFQVKDIDRCMKRLNQEGATFAKAFHTVRDADGSVTTCVVKSCVGDVHHTLIEKSDYAGAFLPGFTPVMDDLEIDDDEAADPLIEYFDHLAIATEMNTSMSVIDWYERCLGMKRFMINRDEDDRRGLVLPNGNEGLRVSAMEYWKCSEVGLSLPGLKCGENKLCIVVTEGLPPVSGSKDESKIDIWMRLHGGPGIHHLALATKNIKETVARLAKSGAVYADPPPAAYYTQFGRLDDITWAGEAADELRKFGILIDTEGQMNGGADHCPSDTLRFQGYLLQIFTSPVFRGDPFFLEIIQRKGATGFGSGNVLALYRSLKAYQLGERKQKMSSENAMIE